MDHAEARERLELAAAEPGGIDRLLDSGAEGEALRAHVADCAECRAEAAELRASAATIQEVIRSTPAPELRARTLDLVATSGRRRDQAATPAEPFRRLFSLPSLISPLSLGAVAVAVLAVVLVWRSVDTRLAATDARVARQQSAIAGLTVVTDWTLRLGTADDAQLMRLAPASGAGSTEDGPSGTVLFSAARGELVMIATGLPAPPSGYQYRCWIDQGSGPQRIGRMYHTGAVAYWGGAVDRLRGIQGPFTLGVSLVSDTSTAPGEPVLIGRQ